MSVTVAAITENIKAAYVSSLNKEEQINISLVQINKQKKTFQKLTNQLKKLSVLFSEITWMNALSATDKVLIKGAIAMGKEADVELRKFYASQKRAYQDKGLFKKELSILKNHIDALFEDILMVEHIVYSLREDEEFKALCDLADEL